MRKRAYPLETLADQRERQVDDAVRGLAAAIAARQTAEERQSAIESRKEAHQAQAAAVRDAERRALEHGQLCAADLALAHAWQLRVDSERATLQEQQQRAREDHAEATREERRAQDQVAARQADARVVDQHRERWAAGERKRDDAAEEEAASEAFRPRR